MWVDIHVLTVSSSSGAASYLRVSEGRGVRGGAWRPMRSEGGGHPCIPAPPPLTHAKVAPPSNHKDALNQKRLAALQGSVRFLKSIV